MAACSTKPLCITALSDLCCVAAHIPGIVLPQHNMCYRVSHMPWCLSIFAVISLSTQTLTAENNVLEELEGLESVVVDFDDNAHVWRLHPNNLVVMHPYVYWEEDQYWEDDILDDNAYALCGHDELIAGGPIYNAWQIAVEVLKKALPQPGAAALGAPYQQQDVVPILIETRCKVTHLYCKSWIHCHDESQALLRQSSC